MKFWTQDQTRSWLNALHPVSQIRSEQLSSSTWSFVGHKKKAVYIDLPKDSRGQADLSRSIIDGISQFEGCVLPITEFGVWVEEQNPVLIERFLLSYGESRTLRVASTFVFDADDRDLAVAILRLLIMFHWDAYLIDPEGYLLVQLVGHEDFAYLIFEGNSTRLRVRPTRHVIEEARICPLFQF